MTKLTKAQRETLEWIGAHRNGVDGVHDTRVVNRLQGMGLLRYSILSDAWYITDAGRAALSIEQGETP